MLPGKHTVEPQGLSRHPSQEQAAGGTGLTPAPGLRHLPGDADVLRSGKDVGSAGPMGETGAEGPGGLTGGL